MNNIIFLDIDGVLKHPTQNIWYPEAVACLNATVNITIQTLLSHRHGD